MSGRLARVLRSVNEHHGTHGDDEQARDDQQRDHRPQNFQASASRKCCLGSGMSPRDRYRITLQYNARYHHQKNHRRNHQTLRKIPLRSTALEENED